MTSAVRGWVLGVAACALLSAERAAQAQPSATAPSTPAASDQPATPERAATPEKAPAPTGDSGGGNAAADDDAKKPASAGGYSWSDAPRKAVKKKRAAPRLPKKLDRNAPTATFPGFRPLPGGGSVVYVSVSKEVPVKVHQAAGRVSYLLEGAQVQVLNNTHPLVTTHFNTPVERIRLVQAKGGVELVMELREAIKPAQRVVKGPRGMMLLEVELPAPSKRYAVPTAAAPLRVESGAAAQPSPASRKRR